MAGERPEMGTRMGDAMETAELYALMTEAVDAILAIVSIYFSVVSAYIAALNFFLRSAPVLLKMAAFAVLSGALAFLGLVIIGVERMTATVLTALREAEPLARAPSLPLYLGMDLEEAAQAVYAVAVGAGWVLAVALYLAMFYLTFIHRWPTPATGAARDPS